ncbi:MAG TPA: hypothetical protein VEX86_15265 [Longimicrobium sp.]|nr:hypothetical protein [Longimicrobium sp.]
MRIDRRLLAAATLLCATALGSCEGSPSGPGERPGDELVFIRAAADAPPLAFNQVQVWAKRGDRRRIEIPYAKVGDYGGDKCLEFTIPGDALLTRPDGTPIARGDSVLITIRVVDPDAFNFEFSPAGLKFSSKDPAELRISYKWANPDFNGDGRVDDDDERFDFDIWKQETEGARWIRIGTSDDSRAEELRADITGFTKYAMAGGV